MKHLNSSNKSKSNKELLLLLKQAEINMSAQYKAAPVCISLKQDNKDYPICSLGNFSLVIGKAKSRKTYFTSTILAAILADGLILNCLEGTLPHSKKGVLLFDTEQSQYHAYNSAKRVYNLSNIGKTNEFKAYSIRKYSPEERLLLVETAILNTPNLGFVVIWRRRST